MGRSSALVALALVAAASLGSARAAGQDPLDAEIAEARALFMAGEAAVESGRWADAVDSFSRAYELSRVPASLFNLGFALRALGRHREARDAFDSLLREHPRFEASLRDEARRYRDEAAERVARLVVDRLDAATRYTVRLDGRPVEDEGERPLSMEGDAGAHTLTVRRGGGAPFVWEGEVAEGQTRVVEAVFPAPTAPDGGPDPGLPDDGGSVFASPWFWLVTAVVLAAGGVLAGWLVHESLQLEPNSSRAVEL
jgi:hypothetical protein